MSKFFEGVNLPPEPNNEFSCYWAAGISHQFKECPGTKDVWINRIQCYGQTEEDAQDLRDRVLRGLELVAAEERRTESSRASVAIQVHEKHTIPLGNAWIKAQDRGHE